MSSSTLATLAVIAAIAAVSPVAADRLRRFRIPAVVLEILAGIVVGPQVWDIAHLDPFVSSLSSFGLAFLMFLAGYEIDFARIRGRALGLASAGWGCSLVVGLGLGLALQADGRALSGLLIGLVFTTTAFSTLLPLWRDGGLLPTRFGAHLLAVGTLGEFGPILAVALLLSGDNPARTSGLLIGFTALALGAAWLATRPAPPALLRLYREQLHTSSQFPVRVSMLLIIVLLWVASSLGLDVLLGAFTAGILVRLGSTEDKEHIVRIKLEAIGFGFLIPIFFVAAGMQFNLTALVHDPRVLARIPVYLAAFLLVRGLPVLLYRDQLDARQRWPMVFFSSTALPLIVVITQLGVSTGRLKSVSAAALVAAGIISVVIFPLISFAILGRESAVPAMPAALGVEETS